MNWTRTEDLWYEEKDPTQPKDPKEQFFIKLALEFDVLSKF